MIRGCSTEAVDIGLCARFFLSTRIVLSILQSGVSISKNLIWEWNFRAKVESFVLRNETQIAKSFSRIFFFAGVDNAGETMLAQMDS